MWIKESMWMDMKIDIQRNKEDIKTLSKYCQKYGSQLQALKDYLGVKAELVEAQDEKWIIKKKSK